MAVDAIDAQIQGLISKAKLESNQKASEHDEADHAAKRAREKLEKKKTALKGSLVDREVFQRDKKVQARLAQVIGGQHGQEAADALRGFENNQKLQSKLTEAQRNQFREAMAKNPRSAAKSGEALNRLAQSETFSKSVRTSQQAGVIQEALIKNPANEANIGKMLGNRFMQSPKADNQARSSLLRFGTQKGAGVGLDRTLDMMGSLAKHDIGRGAQRASMNMAHRRAANPESMETVDRFVQTPAVNRMPMPAKTKATELVAKADGSQDVADGLAELAADPKFKAQTAQNKGRIFATIGSGRPSEFRQLADKNLVALQSGQFPTRSAQVSRFLGQLSATVSRGNASDVDVDTLLKRAKRSPLPEAPQLASEEGLSEEEAQLVRRDNRAKVIQFYTKIARSYDGSEKQLKSAKYFEDINRMANLREPEDVDTSLLSPSDQALVRDRKAKLSERLGELRQVHRQRSRELRTKRMPMSKRRAQAAAARAKGAQPRYFNPHVSSPQVGRQTEPSQAFLRSAPGAGDDGVSGRSPMGLPSTPARGQRAAPRSAPRARGSTGGASAAPGGSIQKQVSAALATLGQGPVTPDVAAAVAQSIASQVASQVAKQVASEVTQQLLASGAGEFNEGLMDADAPASSRPPLRASRSADGSGPGSELRGADRTQGSQGRSTATKSTVPTDGWGIPRNQAAELGATQREIVKPALSPNDYAATNPELPSEAELEPYSGKLLVKDASQVRPLPEMMTTLWKGLSRAEQALLKNLGWSQQTWDTKDTPSARWPTAMATAFMSLSPLQRESLKKLGFSAHDWDKRIQAFTMGKNA